MLHQENEQVKEWSWRRLLKPKYYYSVRGEGYDDMSDIYQSRDETGSLCRPDLYSSTRCIIPYFMAQSLAPYIHVILADVVSIT